MCHIFLVNLLLQLMNHQWYGRHVKIKPRPLSPYEIIPAISALTKSLWFVKFIKEIVNWKLKSIFISIYRYQLTIGINIFSNKIKNAKHLSIKMTFIEDMATSMGIQMESVSKNYQNLAYFMTKQLTVNNSWKKKLFKLKEMEI